MKTTTLKDWSNGIGGAQGNGAVRSSVLQGAVPQPPLPPRQATISAYQPNMFEDLKNDGFLGKFTYNIVDDSYITTRTLLFNYGGDLYHLNGEATTLNGKVGAFAATASSFIPLGRGAYYLVKATQESIIKRGAIDLIERSGAEIAENSALAVRANKRGFIEAGYQFSKHVDREGGDFWRGLIPKGYVKVQNCGIN